MVTQKQNQLLHARTNGISSKGVARKCSFCGSTVSKSRAREQHGDRLVHAPFCRKCESDLR